MSWLNSFVEWSASQGWWLEPIALIIITLACAKYLLFGGGKK